MHSSEHVKEKYQAYDVGELNEDICLEVLSFLMQQLEVLKAYYFLDYEILDSHELDRINCVLRLAKYHTLANRISLLMLSEKRMLTYVPSMLYRCIQAALKVLLLDEVPLISAIMSHGLFSKTDFIDFIIVKVMTVKFVVAKLEMEIKHVLDLAGCIGEDSF